MTRSRVGPWAEWIIPGDDWDGAKYILRGYSHRYVFRGQASAAWSLQSSLERALQNPDRLKEAEHGLLVAFQRRARHYLADKLIPNDLIEWLALMQHHGVPTRLLDWTSSSYVAAYFAIEDATTDSAIWGLDLPYFKERGLERLRRLSVEYNDIPDDVSLSAPEYLRAVFSSNCPGVFPVQPFLMNERLTIQQGTFFVAGDPNKSFMENLLSYGEDRICDHVLKIIISPMARNKALRDLDLMNVNRATLFPGLDGFAQALRYRVSVKGIGEDLEF